MAGSLAFSFAGILSVPPDEDAPPTQVNFGMSGSFQSENTARLALTGSGSVTVSFGTAGSPGVKGFLIEVLDDSAAAPVLLKFDGSSDGMELSPGGFIAYGSPVPVAGVTALVITHTTDVTVRIRVME
jgi:hypothetical protein